MKKVVYNFRFNITPFMFNIFRRSDDKLSRSGSTSHVVEAWSLYQEDDVIITHHCYSYFYSFNWYYAVWYKTNNTSPPHPPTNTGTYTQTHTHILKWRQNFMLKPNTCTCIPINRHRFYMQHQSWKVFDNFFFSSKTVGQHGGIFSLGLFFITCVLEDLYTNLCTLSVDHWLFQGKKCTF